MLYPAARSRQQENTTQAPSGQEESLRHGNVSLQKRRLELSAGCSLLQKLTLWLRKRLPENANGKTTKAR
jgi:hypothetical protein